MTASALDENLRKAMWRYEIISPYLALKPGRGEKRDLLRKLSKETYPDLDGIHRRVAVETMRVWIRRYRKGGLDALRDKVHSQKGNSSLSESQKELLCRLKRDVPERSVERVIQVAEAGELFAPGELSRSKVYRVLAAEGLSKRKLRTPDKKDLDRFEASFPGDLWQSDMLVGPYLPFNGRSHRTKLFLFMDDHSRLVLSGRFSFAEKLPNLELVFRDALRRHGIPIRAYYDNGMVYRAEHMKRIAAELGIHLIYTRPYRPEGHGKVEALNRKIRSSFLAEARASRIESLEELNEAFAAWVHHEHNAKSHREIDMTPLDRWHQGIDKIRFATEDQINDAFTWKETRKADKTGVVSLLGRRYQVGPDLAGRKVDIRFDPESLHEVEIWAKGAFVERARPLEIGASRRPRQVETVAASDDPPVVDYLKTLVVKHQKSQDDPLPADFKQRKHEQAKAQNQALVELLTRRLDESVVDTAAALDFLEKYGPFDPLFAEGIIDEMLKAGATTDQHVSFYLESIREAAIDAALEAAL